MVQTLPEPKSYWMATCNWHCGNTPSDRERRCTCYGSNRVCINNYVLSCHFSFIISDWIIHDKISQHKVTALSNHLAANMNSMSIIDPVFILQLEIISLSLYPGAFLGLYRCKEWEACRHAHSDGIYTSESYSLK